MRAVIFDFDGTLAQSKGNLWKEIWKRLGYDVGDNSYYKSLVRAFTEDRITHKEWCELTCKAYKDKGLTRKIFDAIVTEIKLMNGAENLFKELETRGIELHIVSGNIVDAIESVLGENFRYFTAINANEFVFDEDGYIKDIIGTKYDYEGKARYIEELCKTKNYSLDEILFIGNSNNDEWVYMSGVKTICINPEETDVEDRKIWNKVVYTNNLIDLIGEII